MPHIVLYTIINALCRNCATLVSILAIFSITSVSGRLFPNAVTNHVLINEKQGQFWSMLFWNEARGNLAVWTKNIFLPLNNPDIFIKPSMTAKQYS